MPSAVRDPDMTPFLDLTDIDIAYPPRKVIREASLTLLCAGIGCLLGPNGCGKTSLINIITGYDSATDGSIEIDGSHYGDDDWREVRKRVGIVASTLTVMLESSEPVIDVIASGRDAKLNLW